MRRKCQSCGGWLSQTASEAQILCRACVNRDADAIMRLKDAHRAGGNYLGKARRNFYISFRCWRLMHELSLEYGLSHSGVIEMAVRRFYVNTFGELPGISYAGTTRKPKDKPDEI